MSFRAIQRGARVRLAKFCSHYLLSPLVRIALLLCVLEVTLRLSLALGGLAAPPIRPKLIFEMPQGQGSEIGGVFLFSFSFSFILSSLFLLFSPSHSPFFLSFSLVLPFFFLLLLFSISFSFLSRFPFPLPSSLEVFFFFEGVACTVCFRNVRNDTTDCNQLYLYCNKEICYFLNIGFAL